MPSLLRGFSAPVILESDAEDADRRFLMAHDPDPFVRWELGQSYALKLMLALIAEHRAGRPLAWTTDSPRHSPARWMRPLWTMRSWPRR